MSEGKTLGQFLDSIRGEYAEVKLGTNEGTGFIYCGPNDAEAIRKAADDERQKTLDFIDRALCFFPEMEKNMALGVQRAVAISISRLEPNETEKDGEIGSEKFKELLTDTAKAAAKKSIAGYEQKIRTRLATINDYFSRLNPWVDIMNREVVEFYPSIAEDSTLIVIFKGLEVGEYWDKSEYRQMLLDKQRRYRKTYYTEQKGAGI